MGRGLRTLAEPMLTWLSFLVLVFSSLTLMGARQGALGDGRQTAFDGERLGGATFLAKLVKRDRIEDIFINRRGPRALDPITGRFG